MPKTTYNDTLSIGSRVITPAGNGTIVVESIDTFKSTSGSGNLMFGVLCERPGVWELLYYYPNQLEIDRKRGK